MWVNFWYSEVAPSTFLANNIVLRENPTIEKLNSKAINKMVLKHHKINTKLMQISNQQILGLEEIIFGLD